MKASILLLGAAALYAQQPHVENGKLESRVFSGSLQTEISRVGAGPAWLAWAEPMAGGRNGEMCWWNENGYGGHAPDAPVRLEGPTELVVLVRIENSQVNKIRVASIDCRLDTGGVPFYWLTGVPASESISWLRTRNLDSAISAIAFHADSSALPTLIDAARNDPSAKIRKQSLFWLAERAAESIIVDAIARDPDRSVREHAVFALSLLPSAQGTPLLIDIAKNNSDPAVRKRAMFWLGQSTDPRALDFIAGLLK
jgi:hypothetical protein